jgi:hypothetical protein
MFVLVVDQKVGVLEFRENLQMRLFLKIECKIHEKTNFEIPDPWCDFDLSS